MNKRIKELAEQAMATRKHVPPVWQMYDIEMEKFAELLIKECAMVVKNVQPGYKDYRSQIEEAMQDGCVEAIKQHFEIKD